MAEKRIPDFDNDASLNNSDLLTFWDTVEAVMKNISWTQFKDLLSSLFASAAELDVVEAIVLTGSRNPDAVVTLTTPTKIVLTNDQPVVNLPVGTDLIKWREYDISFQPDVGTGVRAQIVPNGSQVLSPFFDADGYMYPGTRYKFFWDGVQWNY